MLQVTHVPLTPFFKFLSFPADPDTLQQSLDNLNAFASQLSAVFQKLGTASTGPTEEVKHSMTEVLSWRWHF